MATPSIDHAAWRRWHEAAADPSIDAVIAELYAALDGEIAARGPTCWQSGKCCNFGAYGHRLYVTGLEVARFLHWLAEDPTSASAAAISHAGHAMIALPQMRHHDVCPYQVDRACTVHTHRPLGCRIYFCQAGTETWQHDLYERYLRTLADLHEEHALPYRYADWLALLEEASRASRWSA